MQTLYSSGHIVPSGWEISQVTRRRIYRSSAFRTGAPLALVGIVGFFAGPAVVTFALAAWDKFFLPALVQVSLSGLRWCM